MNCNSEGTKPHPDTKEGQVYVTKAGHRMLADQGKTPCGYQAGGLKASDGTRYRVLDTGQIVRREPKMGKAEMKRHKRERRLNRKQKTENRKQGLTDAQ